MLPISDLISSYEKMILPLLQSHESFAPEEERLILAQFKDFVLESENHFSRQNTYGHFTGSALLLSPDQDEVLLTHHKKLNKWLQLGGHADEEEDLYKVALTEAEEESGIIDLNPVNMVASPSPLPFDFDFHHIPDGTKSGHIHFDVRFLLRAGHKDFSVSEESHDLRWWPLKDAPSANPERSMIRQYHKLSLLLKEN